MFTKTIERLPGRGGLATKAVCSFRLFGILLYRRPATVAELDARAAAHSNIW
jgi:hypothetical protein